jgi:heat shock protein HslJ
MKEFSIVLLGFIFVMLGIFMYSKYPADSLFKDNKQVPELPAPQAIHEPYGQWKWEYAINSVGTEIRPKDSADFILTLTPEGRLTSTTDCNTASGSYIRNENVINIGPLMSTKKACEGEVFESLYLTYLSLASTYQIQDNTLTVYMVNNSGLMVFSLY